MKIQMISSPFSRTAFVLKFNDMILCNPEEDGGLPVEWISTEGAFGMLDAIQDLGWGDYQWLYESTCHDRMNKKGD